LARAKAIFSANAPRSASSARTRGVRPEGTDQPTVGRKHPTAFDGRSDYKPFQDAGLPAGGLFSGAEVAKTADQAARWGGTAGVAFDPNYHQAGDTIDNLDMAGGEYLADGAAHVAAINMMEPNLRQRLGTAGAAAAHSSGVSERLGSRLQK